MRAEGWEAILHDHIKEAYQRPFLWGEHDCALWCADWVRKATGRDLLSGWVGEYATGEEAKRLMNARGFADVAAIADRHLTAVPVAYAKRGDIVLHPQTCLGICHGRGSYFLGVKDVTREPTLHCAQAWAVD